MALDLGPAFRIALYSMIYSPGDRPPTARGWVGGGAGAGPTIASTANSTSGSLMASRFPSFHARFCFFRARPLSFVSRRASRAPTTGRAHPFDFESSRIRNIWWFKLQIPTSTVSGGTARHQSRCAIDMEAQGLAPLGRRVIRTSRALQIRRTRSSSAEEIGE